jgi:choline dehydrogenase-like flavoprotein
MIKDTTTVKPDGTITAYGFACGIVQRSGDVTLYKDGVYHVQGLGLWESYGSLTEARRAFARLAKRARAGDKALQEIKAGFDKLMQGLARV